VTSTPILIVIRAKASLSSISTVLFNLEEFRQVLIEIARVEKVTRSDSQSVVSYGVRTVAVSNPHTIKLYRS
jgi:hypothetical protein